MFSGEEEIEVQRVQTKYNEISSSIKTLSNSCSQLEEITNSKKLAIESNFDQLIFKLKNRKVTLLDDFKKVTSTKKKLLLTQMQRLKIEQKKLNNFNLKCEQMILGESHGLDDNERKKYIMETTKQLLNSNIETHPIVNANMKVDLSQTKQLLKLIDSLGDINPCNIPYPPKVTIQQIHASSAKIHFVDVSMLNTPAASEFKIEILRKTSVFDKMWQNDDQKSDKNGNYLKNGSSSQKRDEWETAMIVDNGEDECYLRGLSSKTAYLVRVSSWNINGWSACSRSLYFKTKYLSKIGQRLIYLAPTPIYQNKLSILMTSYFVKWKGFHVTIGGRHRAGQISSSEIAQELSELGLKNGNTNLWQIPDGKWKILGGKDLIVLGLDEDISIFNIASKFLVSKGWSNVKKKNFHITLGLKKDLNREQIKEMAQILIDKEDPVKWEWVSIKETPDGKIVWDQRFPAYHL